MKLFATLLSLLLATAAQATVTNTTTSSTAACDGVQTAYTIGFPYQASADISATSTTAGGVATALVLTTDYTLSATSTKTTATLTLAAGSRCPAGSTLRIYRNIALTQTCGLPSQGEWNPASLERCLDRLAMQIQQIYNSISTPVTTTNFSGNPGATFTGGTTRGALRLVPQADPSTTTEGDVWYSTGTGPKFRGSASTFTLATLTAPTFTGTTTVTKLVQAFNGLVFSTPVAINANSGTYFFFTPTAGAYTVQNPTNATTGQLITLIVKNTSGGALGAATWDTAYKLSAWTNPANGFQRSISFVYTGATWVEVSRTPSDVPN